MLVAFALTNYACFRERHELSAQAVTRASDLHAFDSGSRRAPRLNRVTAIYGPNGSGKSRLLLGLMFAKSFVVKSATSTQAGEEIPYTPFLFDTETRSRPTIFEVSFIEDGSCYEYTFSLDRERVHSESLLVWPPDGRKRLLLERRWDVENQTYEWTFGHSVSGPKEVWRRSTRQNALLVSVAAQLNSDIFTPVVEWFRKRLAGIGPDYLPDTYTAEAVLADDTKKRRVLELLRAADITAADVSVRREKTSLESMRESVPPSILKELSKTGADSVESFQTQLGHAVDGSSDLQFLDLEQESDGTQRLFALAWPLLDILDNDRVLVVDELDHSLHPLVVEALLRRLNSGSDSSRRGQLIATLHDTTLLGGALGRGQIWLTDKERPSEAANLTPLSHFHPRRQEALERGYLTGRYGGIPVTSTPHFVPTD